MDGGGELLAKQAGGVLQLLHRHVVGLGGELLSLVCGPDFSFGGFLVIMGWSPWMVEVVTVNNSTSGPLTLTLDT